MSGPLYRIVHTEASLGWGGQEIRVLSEAARLAALGHTLHLVCDPDSDIHAAAGGYGIESTAIPMKKKTLGGLLAMRRFLRRWQPDIVNAHSSIDHWLAAGARTGLSPRPAIVRTRHIGAPVARNATSRWLYNRGADYVMATSGSIVHGLTHDGFLPAGKVAAVPTGIDTTLFSPGDKAAARAADGLPRDAFIFVVVATLRSWKGHSYLLDALTRLPAPTMLVIVGDGPQEENLRRQAAGLGLDDRVVMTGRRKDVLPWLQAADAFVLPSYANEGVPQALVQAMACRLPVASCPVGGIPETVEGLEAVRLAEPRNAESLAAAMAEIMNGAWEDETLDALRIRVVERHSSDVMVGKVLAAFRAATAAAPGRPGTGAHAGSAS